MQGIGFTCHRKAETTLRVAKAGSSCYFQSFERRVRRTLLLELRVQVPWGGRNHGALVFMARPRRDTAQIREERGEEPWLLPSFRPPISLKAFVEGNQTEPEPRASFPEIQN